MSHRLHSRWPLAILLVLFLLLLSAAAEIAAAPTAPIDPAVLQTFGPKDEATFWVIMKEKANLDPAYKIKDWTRGVASCMYGSRRPPCKARPVFRPRSTKPRGQIQVLLDRKHASRNIGPGYARGTGRSAGC